GHTLAATKFAQHVQLWPSPSQTCGVSSRRAIDRGPPRLATILKPAPRNSARVPVKSFRVLLGSEGYSSSAGAFARFAFFTAAARRAEATPLSLYPLRTEKT